MQDSLFVPFLGFAGLWLLFGAGMWLAVLKMEKQDFNAGNTGWFVTGAIVVPFLLALLYGAIALL